MDYRKHIAKSRLSTEEKADLRSEFLSRTGLKSSPSNYLINQAPHYVGIAALSLLLVAVGASPFAIAAENAEPGDFLYPVKTAVNEPVKKVVRTVVGKKTAEPASQPDARLAEENTKNSEPNPSTKKNEMRQKSKSGDTEPTPSILPAASVIHATDSQVKKIVDTATKKIKNAKIADEATQIVPVEILTSPKDESETKKKDTKKRTSSTGDPDDDSDSSAIEDRIGKAADTVDGATDTVSDTVEQASKIIDISL